MSVHGAAGAGADAESPVDILQGLPRAVRELSIAAVGAAHARDSLDQYTLEAEALSRDTADAAARMPEVQAVALEGQASLTARAPALLEVCVPAGYGRPHNYVSDVLVQYSSL